MFEKTSTLNHKEIWRVLNELIGNKKTYLSFNCINKQSISVTYPKELSELFIQNFQKLPKIQNNLVNDNQFTHKGPSSCYSMFLSPTFPEEFHICTQSIKNKNSIPSNNLPNMLLKTTSSHGFGLSWFIVSITMICNKDF